MTIQDSKWLVGYMCFYMHKMYEEVDKMQQDENYKWNDSYFIDEKLQAILWNIQAKWIDNFIEDVKKITLEDLKDEYFMNIL